MRITEAYEQAYELLKSQSEPISGADLARLAGCSGTAMCNRLVHLEQLGLARGQRVGRRRLWVATPSRRENSGANRG